MRADHCRISLRDRLAQERCDYIMFPEGTRTRTGAMARFRGGLGRLVAGTDVPVVPCHLAGTFEAMPPGRRWPRRVPVTVRIGRPLHFGDVPDDRRGWDVVAARAEDEVRAMEVG